MAQLLQSLGFDLANYTRGFKENHCPTSSGVRSESSSIPKRILMIFSCRGLRVRNTGTSITMRNFFSASRMDGVAENPFLQRCAGSQTSSILSATRVDGVLTLNSRCGHATV